MRKAITLFLLLFYSCSVTKYRVEWKSELTGKTGHGEWFKNKRIVQDAVKEGNGCRCGVNHWIGVKN